MWTSLTITAFGAQITNLALPLTAALLLHATPLQMGVLVALETLPFALVSLHASKLDPALVAETLGCILKDESDLRKVKGEIDAGRLPLGASA